MDDRSLAEMILVLGLIAGLICIGYTIQGVFGMDKNKDDDGDY